MSYAPDTPMYARSWVAYQCSSFTPFSCHPFGPAFITPFRDEASPWSSVKAQPFVVAGDSEGCCALVAVVAS
jgi:hypothetical protein